MRQAEKFTPEVLIEAPRRGPAVPNADGTTALFSTSTHTIGGDTLKEVKILDLSTGGSHVLAANSKGHDFTWLTANSVAFLEPGEKDGETQLMITNATAQNSILEEHCYVAATLSGPVNSLKLKSLKDGSVALAVVGKVDSDGNLFNGESEPKKSSIRVYDNFNVRFVSLMPSRPHEIRLCVVGHPHRAGHDIVIVDRARDPKLTFCQWDSYIQPQRYTIWYARLKCTSNEGVERWELDGKLNNLLPNNPEIEAPSSLKEGFFDGANTFDISEDGIVFTAQDPQNKNPLYKLTTKVFFIRLPSWSGQHPAAAPREIPCYRDTSKGMYTNPRISPDGKLVAFLKRSVERQQDARLYVAGLGESVGAMLPGSALDVYNMVTGRSWGLVPLSFEFMDNHSLVLAAQDFGFVTLHRLKLQPNAIPELIFKNGSVSGYWPIYRDGVDKILVTSSSLVESSLYSIVDGNGESDAEVVSSASHNGAKLGLSPEQISEIYFSGAGDYSVQAWVVKPRDFTAKKKYPLCMLVHGGPESCWNNAWSTRWNPAAFAEQGYVVVAPNITGSVGFGLEHTERIYGSWGGYPYQDLEKCLEHLQGLPNLDLDNAVAAGGSYGGYMMLWLQGNDLGRKFKALVCHDGVFHLPSFLLECDEPIGLHEDFKGAPYIWNNLRELEKWSPARPDLLKKWKTPMLIAHSDLDFRVPVTEGIAAFNTCQALGIESRFVNFPDENHFVLKEENSLQWHRHVFAWLNKFSGIEASTKRSV